MKKLTNLLFIGFIVSLMSFDFNSNNPKNEAKVYSFTRDGEESPLIKLELKKDGTFEFTDNANPAKNIQASGAYEIKGNQIKLSEIESNHSIATTWRIDDKYDCIKSRKALKFTRICSGDCN